ncbi:GGDEF domain-containing protein [Paucibacter sp. PLA-PC-4]|uniref:GGDEF domain-containing protein n=1 Tax=Paucibacter sp. PLA-PC-4 TaxID=2993655 RepID=UPI0022487C96|nr:GGDEF domain-containing protein [Paucibacter sp. PLA-PC-4]MCX2861253.1 GGDEF domain-containing protein [Paucibacter sp. PLA-PC-4]
MSEVVEHLAELTGFRDRDVMDVTLVSALRDLVEPLSVAIFRLVGEAGQERWLTRARLVGDAAVASADSVWAERLPSAHSHPDRLDCMHERHVLQRREGEHWLTLFPIATEREVVGVLEIESCEKLKNSDQRLVGSILRIYHNFQGLLDYSERDTLTGLLNRKTFDESFLKAVGNGSPISAIEQADDGRRHEGQRPSYWLGVIDIDHFKRVNDSFGHLIGDEVLLLLSRLMRNTFRFHDLLYRFGGEEFVVLMRCTDELDAAQAFERLRLNTEAYQFPQVGHITVSIGFTPVRPEDSPASAFERADRAVYHAKSAGRNQVQSHAALLAMGLMQEPAKLSAVELF